MLEMHLIAIFLICVLFLVVGGIYAVNSADSSGSLPRIFILLPVGKDTADIEFVVRKCIYKAAEQYPETMILFYDLGADRDTVYIFEKLMQFSCSYYIVDTKKKE